MTLKSNKKIEQQIRKRLNCLLTFVKMSCHIWLFNRLAGKSLGHSHHLNSWRKGSLLLKDWKKKNLLSMDRRMQLENWFSSMG